MTWLCVLAVLSAAPDAKVEDAPTPAVKKMVKLGAPTFSSANVSAEVTNVASEHFAQQLSLQGLRVVTSSEIAALLGLERQQQLLGCAEDTSCMVELSNALGVDGIVTGSLGSFGGRFTVNVKVLGAKDGTQLGVFSATAESERGLPDVLSRAAQDIGKQVKVALGLEEAPEHRQQVVYVQQAFTQRQKWALVPGIVAVLVFVGSGTLFGQAQYRYDSINDGRHPDLNVAKAFQFQAEGETFRIGGWVAVGVGAACVAGAAWLFFWGTPPAVAPTVALGPQGVTLGLQGALPW